MIVNLYSRDYNIYCEWRKHQTVDSLSKKYNLSKNRIRRIIIDFPSKGIDGRFDIPEIDEIGLAMGIRPQELKKIQKVMRANGYTSEDSAWRYISINELKSMKGLSDWWAGIVWLAQQADI